MQFSRLVPWLEAADLAGALSRRDVKLTLFAPTNKAFIKLPHEFIQVRSNVPLNAIEYSIEFLCSI